MSKTIFTSLLSSLFLSVASVSSLGAVEIVRPPERQIIPVEDTIDAGDHYLLSGGKRVNLLRTAEVAVRFSSPVSPEQGLATIQSQPGVPALERVGYASFREAGRTDIVRPSSKASAVDPKRVASSPGVDYAFPVLVDPESKTRMVPTDEILVRFAEGVVLADAQKAIAGAGLVLKEKTSARRLPVYVFRLVNPKTSDPLEVSRTVSGLPNVVWAEPNFVREVQFYFTPNDPLFGQQQTMNNTGQNGGLADADVDAPEAWNTTTGSPTIVIAIIDDGVDTSHPDLNIYANPGESGGGKETNGIDDDGDGKIDDYRGWDFAGNDNNPNPIGTNGHGTGTAGVAAAIGNNGTRIAGIAGGCKVLPVKIADDSGVFTTDQAIGEAISYAADFADILSNSWGGGSPSSFIDNAIDDAVTNGRNGKGSPVFFATGNAASKWNNGGSRVRVSLGGLSGSFYFGVSFYRGSTSAGENLVRLDDVCLLDADGYTHKTSVLPNQDFEGATFPPAGWSTLVDAGSAAWVRSSVNTKTGTGGSFSAQAPTLSAGTWSAELLTPLLTLNGTETLAFDACFSCGSDSAFFLDVYDASLTYVAYVNLKGGDPTVQTDISYPASQANAIAVGASTDRDLRSDYSQYGGKIDFVAPSNGGWNDVATLDPTGTVGWTATDYKMNFGGTSAACPLAAGIGALMLSVNPNLTASEIRTLMRNTADKIGGVTYSGGFNQYYGYGRVNAQAAVAAALPTPPVLANIESSPLSYTENQLPTAITASLSVSGSGNLATATVSITSGLAAAQDVLAMSPSPQNGISSSYNSGSGVLTLSGSSSVANYQTALRSVTYANNSDSPSVATRTISFKVNDGSTDSNIQTRNITVTPVADTPSVTGASTLEDTQTTSGLVISRNAADGPEVTHFKITGITAGSLFQHDGTTPISNGDFITFAQGNAGLKFTPAANSIVNGSFVVQASTSNVDGGLGGSPVTATITVTPVADTPSVTGASTLEDTQTTSGLVISRNAADGPEVTHFKITGITAGLLFQHDGTTAISNGDFITFAQGNVGLKFTPAANSIVNGSFVVQASTSNTDAGLGGSPVTATITVTSVNDAPTGTTGTVTTQENTSYTFAVADFGFSDPNDSPANGCLAVKVATLPLAGTLTSNSVPVAAGWFIGSVAIAAGELKFTPTANANGDNYASFTFQVQDDGGTANGGVDLDPSPKTLTVNVSPAPTHVITGTILTETGAAGGGVTLTAGDGGSSVESGSDGGYSLTVPCDWTGNVTPSKADDTPPNAGVTTADITLIRRHILALVRLNSPYKLIAADVNGDNDITTADITFIRRVILGLATDFPAGLWKYVTSDYTFPNPAVPWSPPFPANRSYEHLCANTPGQDYLAIKLGDVSGDWAPQTLAGASGQQTEHNEALRTVQSLASGVPAFSVGMQSVMLGDTVSVPIRVSGFAGVTSVQFTLAWDPAALRFVSLSDFGLLGLSGSNFNSQVEGRLTCSWDDPGASGITVNDGMSFCSVQFKAVGTTGAISTLQFEDSPTVRELTVDFVEIRADWQKGGVSVETLQPRCVGIRAEAAGALRIVFAGTPGKTYRIESSESLAPADWTLLESTTADSQGRFDLLESAFSGLRSRFYRAVDLPLPVSVSAGR